MASGASLAAADGDQTGHGLEPCPDGYQAWPRARSRTAVRYVTAGWVRYLQFLPNRTLCASLQAGLLTSLPPCRCLG
jgi:hypothetical protein